MVFKDKINREKFIEDFQSRLYEQSFFMKTKSNIHRIILMIIATAIIFLFQTPIEVKQGIGIIIFLFFLIDFVDFGIKLFNSNYFIEKIKNAIFSYYYFTTSKHLGEKND